MIENVQAYEKPRESHERNHDKDYRDNVLCTRGRVVIIIITSHSHLPFSPVCIGLRGILPVLLNKQTW